VGKLTALTVQCAGTGMHGDGDGLYLQVKGDARSWIFRYTLNGKTRDLGLGSAKAIPLKRARELAQAASALRAEGIDPIEHRRAKRLGASLEAAKALTFKDAATAFIAGHRAGWRNTKHAAQWESTLAAYVFPVFGDLSVAAIDTTLVLKAIEPIWTAKPETASRVRGRIEAILDWATTRGDRAGENPGRWRGHLRYTLPAPTKVRRVKHHASLPYNEITAFMASLRARDSISARCLEFTILTAARTSEVIGATWSEIDRDHAVWTIPANRMKAGKEHRVPLSGRAVDILRELQRDPAPWGASSSSFGPTDPVFARAGKHLSNMALLKMLALAGRDDLTVHGFRSTLRTWAAERTTFPREVIEAALAHVVGNRVEAAYQRGDLFDKRRRLMDAWAEFVGRPGGSE
jgi:integrase